MLLRWPQNHIEEEHLNYWISSSIQDETFLRQTLQLLDDLSNSILSEGEIENLKKLLEFGEVDLLYRYLDLQLNHCLSDVQDALKEHESQLLERELQEYLSSPKSSHFKLEIGMRCIQNVLENWFISLKVQPAAEFYNLKEAHLGKKIDRVVQEILKEQSFSLPIRDKLFLEEFLKGLQESEDDIEYLSRFCSEMEQLSHWEHVLEEIKESLQAISVEEELDKSTLKHQLDFFEQELSGLHKLFGKTLSSMFSSFSETQQAIKIGRFRKLFQELNNIYSELKGRLLDNPCDMHLCCMCHFGEAIREYWPINNRVIEISAENREHASHNFPGCQSGASLLIFTCGGGNGHLSTAKAMSQYASGKYHILVASTLEETLAPTDVLKKMLFDFSQEKLYNHLLKNEEFEWLKLVTSVGPFFIMMQQENIERLIRLEVLKQNPDMIISCFPIMNAMFLNVAKELNLPLLIVTTDLDTGQFIKGMNSNTCDLNYPSYRMTLAYEDPQMREIAEKVLPKDKVIVSGFPLRSAFKEQPKPEELAALRAKFQIASNEVLILIMMGGNASLAIEKYGQILADFREEDFSELIQEGKRLHVLCLCGSQQVETNRRMLERINQIIPKNKLMRLTAIGATDEVSSLMNLADLLITKPGGCTTNEALAMKLPMIFHAPFALMDWEVFNMEFCIRMKMGARFKLLSNVVSFFQDGFAKNKQRLLPLIKEGLKRRQELRQQKMPFEMKDFHVEFMKLVEQLVFG